MKESATFVVCLLLPTLVQAQQLSTADVGEAVVGEVVEKDSDEEHYENDVLVIVNRFPKDLNFFCNPRNELMRDRICYGQVDAYALACAEDTPPLHLVPFCLAFKSVDHRGNFPGSKFSRPDNSVMSRRHWARIVRNDITCNNNKRKLHFQRHCSLVNYPADDWCSREFDRYEDFCTRTKISKCKSCSYDLSCYCEPYECLWRRWVLNLHSKF
ncbi:hypothetical protein ANCCAN_10207 [Ancylostoma caninum]|uniref:Uncharacterized protein n=1 Tax=Ancylostoma caninum TaxID=29170 RepID=A0A368GJF6_ANCCA|nr:hypothetical protein ANCCAN_10207 [Ancylostoma caninum]